MPFSETFSDDLAVSVGGPTKASEYNSLSGNTDALKERFAVQHYINNTGVEGEDGYHFDVVILQEDAAAASIVDALTLQWNPSGGSGLANSAGIGISVKLDDAGGNITEVGTMEWVYVDSSASSEDVDLVFRNIANASLSETLRILSTGGIQFSDASSFTSADTLSPFTIESSGATTYLSINNTAADGDPGIDFQLSGVSKGTIIIDDGDSDIFKITSSGGLLISGTTSTVFSSGSIYLDPNNSIKYRWKDATSHGITTVEETDIGFSLTEGNRDGAGGITMNFFNGDNAVTQAARIRCHAVSGSTTHSATGRAMYQIDCYKKSGTGVTDPDANWNLFGIGSNVDSLVFIVDSDGDLFADGGTTTTAVTVFDEHDDAELIRALDISRRGKGIIEGEFDKFISYNEDHLVELGILGDTRKNRGLVCFTKLAFLHNGAIWQHEIKIRKQQEAIIHLSAERDEMKLKLIEMEQKLERIAA